MTLGGVRVGVVRDHFGAHPAADSVTESAVALLGAAGATLVDAIPAVSFPEPPSEDDDDYLKVLLYELQHGLTAYLATRPAGSPRTLAEIVAFNRTHADAELQWFGQEYLERASELPGLDSVEYRTARASILRTAREEGLDASFGQHGVDVLVAPAFPPAAMNDLILGDPAGPGGDCTTAPAIAGYPIISVPIGFVHGLPIGLAITGPAGAMPYFCALRARSRRVSNSSTTALSYRRCDPPSYAGAAGARPPTPNPTARDRW